MQVTELKTQLKTGALSGVYILCGEENYLKRYYLGEIRKVLLPDPTFDAFNHAIAEGEKADYAWLSDAASAPPMMAERKLVEWHLCNFNGMLSQKKDKDKNKNKEKEPAQNREMDQFAAFCEEVKDYPESVTVFVADADCLDAGTARAPSKLYQTLSKYASVVCFEKSTDASLYTWIDRHFRHDGVEADPGVAPAMLARCGHSMDALSGEMTKLVSYAKCRALARLTPADVEAVCSATTESDAFGLTNAILDGRADAAYAYLRDMRLRKVDPTVALASVTRTYADLVSVAAMAEDGLPQAEIAGKMNMHDYKAKLYLRCAKKQSLAKLEAALALCRATDAATKSGTGLDGYLSIEYLIARTLA